MKKSIQWNRLFIIFCYEHRKIGTHMAKIRRCAEELGKALDDLPPKKGRK